MKKLRYSKDVNVLVIELSQKPIAYAEEHGQFILHFTSEGEPVLLEIQDGKDFILESLSTVLRDQEVTIP